MIIVVNGIYVDVKSWASTSAASDAYAKPGPVPQIMFNGSNIVGQTVTVYVGQRIALSAVFTVPSGTTITTQSWSSPPGQTVGGYTPSTGPTHVQRTFALTNSDLLFYWTDAGTSRRVTYSYTLSDRETNSATATFTVIGPTGNLVLAASMPQGNVRVYNITRAGATTPVLGLKNSTTNVGISFTSNAVAPSGLNQSFTWVQTISSVQTEYLGSNGPGLNPPESGLDNTYPYANANPRSTNDSPNAVLPETYGEGWEAFTATMYLMWDPALPSGCTPASTDPATLVSTPSTCASIPVPLSSVTWHWSGCAINAINAQSNGTNWIFSTASGCPVQILSTPQLSGFPEWDTLVQNR
jgi:hypothetical protein